MSYAMQETLLQPHPVKRVKRTRGVSVHTIIVDVACGSYATYAVDEAGNVWAWGLNNYGQLGMEGQVSLCLHTHFAFSIIAVILLTLMSVSKAFILQPAGSRLRLDEFPALLLACINVYGLMSVAANVDYLHCRSPDMMLIISFHM